MKAFLKTAAKKNIRAVNIINQSMLIQRPSRTPTSARISLRKIFTGEPDDVQRHKARETEGRIELGLWEELEGVDDDPVRCSSRAVDTID